MKKYNLYTIFLFFYLIFVSSIVIAQPSGDPYGPIAQTYKLPDIDGKIYFISPEGKSEADGLSLENPTTIENVVKKVVSGDAIIMRGGTYRTGDLFLNQSILIQPYKDEIPVLKGTLVAENWEQQQNGLWVTTWNKLFPEKPQSWWRRHRHGADTPQHRFNNDMVFADGRFLQSVGWEGELDENSYYINYKTGKVYLKIDPTKHEIEITAYKRGIIYTPEEVNGKKSDGRGPIIKGITITQYATQCIEVLGYYPEKLSDDNDHGNDIVGTTFEHCTISFSARMGGNFIGDSLVIRNCKVSDTSTEGIYIVASDDVLLEKNIITRNNIEVFNGYYPAAVKIFNQSYRVVCRDNLVIDHENSTGIWYDVGNVDGIFINNWLENIHYDEEVRKPDDVWPSGAGFYFEISKGAICAGNVFINCDSGIHLRNASDVYMYQNTFVNSQVIIGRTERTATGDHFDWHPSTGPGLHERFGHKFKNNLLVGDDSYTKPLLSVWQRAAICGKVEGNQLNELDNNVYVYQHHLDNPLFLWSPVEGEDCRTNLNSLKDLEKLRPKFSKSSIELRNYNGSLFKSIHLGHYELAEGFSGNKAANLIDEEVRRVLKLNEKISPYVGAYPLK